jgi:hypothetical protein
VLSPDIIYIWLTILELTDFGSFSKSGYFLSNIDLLFQPRKKDQTKISGRIYGKAFKKSRIFSQTKISLALLRFNVYNLLK